MTDQPATIANPKLADLQHALTLAQGVADLTETRLDDVKTQMVSGQAWTGTSQSDDFYRQLTAHITALKTAGERCVENVQAALSSCPATVANPAATTTPKH